jgi:hypothetical protein
MRHLLFRNSRNVNHVVKSRLINAGFRWILEAVLLSCPTVINHPFYMLILIYRSYDNKYILIPIYHSYTDD